MDSGYILTGVSHIPEAKVLKKQNKKKTPTERLDASF